jgi:UDP-glucose:(glucosyl)LPS alpha-1,2-glucosyltransferase
MTEQTSFDDPWRTEMTKNAMGGTELQMTWLYKNVDKTLLSNFQIIPSRVGDLDNTKLRVLWCHDLAEDPANHHLADGGWEKFHRIVFVSYTQRAKYLEVYGIPYSKTMVLQNAIEPIEDHTKPLVNDRFNIIYHTTPHRGLEILVPVVERLVEDFPNIHLDVYSSFGVYGWSERDKRYEALFDRIRNHDNMSYHGAKTNDEVRAALHNAHIFAYPSIWPETSCISLMEAMSAGCLCVHSNFGALPETAANWTWMYNHHEDPNRHAGTLHRMMKFAIENYASFDERLYGQRTYADIFYSWNVRKEQWTQFLESFLNEERAISEGPIFNYRTT